MTGLEKTFFLTFVEKAGCKNKNRLRGSKPSAFTWKTSPLWYSRANDGKYLLVMTYKFNVILAMGNIIVVLRRKPDAMTLLVLPNVNLSDFIAAEMLLQKRRYRD